MPQTRIGRLLYVLVLLTGFLLLGSSLFRKHKPTAINGPSPVFLTAPANTALAQAIDAGNIPTVKSLFLKRPDIKQVVDTNTGETPLLRAVHRGQLEVTRLLLAHGAAPQEAMSATVSGLYHGYSLGNGRLNRTNYEAIYKTLRAQDVALTPVQAVQMNDLAALQSAVKAGANVNSAERWDGTPPVLCRCRWSGGDSALAARAWSQRQSAVPGEADAADGGLMGAKQSSGDAACRLAAGAWSRPERQR